MRGISFYKSLFLTDFLDRPPYAYAVYQAARQAQALQLPRISLIEFGVAGGNGLVNLEKHAAAVRRELGVAFDIYGFDTGAGLPELEGYKDIMHQWRPGFFPMDAEKLRARLKTAKLVLGDIRDTLATFFEDHKPAPIGAILFDLDLYSSTRAAFRIFDAAPDYFLPRVRCYFDDINGNETSLTNEFTGERLAIAEYNAASDTRKITPVHHLLAKPRRRKWYARSFAHHRFDHPRYCDFIGAPAQSNPLNGAD